ncbi:hypothetical protein M747DRAFT_68800 [Aspergillus niger ATCC 13496]|uniref:Uncharacterized protein n=1 Tax=Aspergillus niger ATCC 13496 TaxID=1353008 RepID=A0A370BZ61_ASPNG|nr:hypothetical protein M747DRAFT_68800 [Aspergillus niger ATCC 13496]
MWHFFFHLWGPGQKWVPPPRLQAPCLPRCLFIPYYVQGTRAELLQYHLTRGSQLLTPGLLSPPGEEEFFPFPDGRPIKSQDKVFSILLLHRTFLPPSFDAEKAKPGHTRQDIVRFMNIVMVPDRPKERKGGFSHAHVDSSLQQA